MTGDSSVIAAITAPITFTAFCAGSGSCWNQSTNFPIASAATLITSLTIGMICSASRLIASSNFACASFDSTRAAFVSRYPCATPARPWDARTSIIICARSDSELVLCSFSLNSSSLIPAQFSASAKVPVTVPTCAVSLIASARPSIGMESPYCAHAPIASSVICTRSDCERPSACKFAVAVAAVCVSPNTPYSWV